MTLRSPRELEVTRQKLRQLEEQYKLEEQEGDKSYAHELTLRSLKKWINRLTEEIARFKAHAKSSH